MTADDPESDSEPALWLREALSLLTPDEISSADSNVCEYITHIARHIAFNLYLSTKFREVEESATWSVENELRRTLAVKKTLSGFEDQFLPFLARSEAVKGFLDDLKTWKEKCREQMDDLMQELHNSHLEKEAAVQDSNQLLEEAIGVKRLCFVATIFLPLTFTSSVFGMNVVQLGSGTAQIWAFIAVAVSVMAVTFIFLAVSHRLSIHPPTT
jgi:Mg2+ and Co2+ transporter CorA